MTPEIWQQDRTCPQCGRTFKYAGAYYWHLNGAGIQTARQTKVYCCNACRQRAYRARRALDRNGGKHPQKKVTIGHI